MKYPGWETDAELEDEYQKLISSGVSESFAEELTAIECDKEVK